ncbi:MAG: type IV pilus modification PilV family protein [Candidatus Rifleibacteriota bacterium]
MKSLRSGLSMVELLVAIAVLGGALLPIWHLHYQSSRRVVIGENQTLIKNISYAFAGQVRRFDPNLMPVGSGFIKLIPAENGLYHLGGPSTINNVSLPEWNPAMLNLEYQIRKLDAIPRDNRLVVLKITWTRKDTGPTEFFVPTLVSHD